MLSMVEASLTLSARVSEMMDEGRATIGHIAMAKSAGSKWGREVCALAREVCGGNGILIDNQVMKHLMDMEIVHTYEGTYEVNTLVTGREVTGLAAFK